MPAVRAKALSRVTVLLTAVVVAFFLLLASRVQAGSELRPTAIHVVQSGETLWSIATATGDQDVRRAIYEIRRLNALDSSAILAGQRLVVPAGR